jgi:hypothetical protein
MKHQVPITLICGVIALGLFGSGYSSQAQQAQGSSYQAMSDKVFTMLQQDRAADAVDYLLSTNPAMKKVPDQVDQLRSQFSSIGTLMGAYISHSMLVETKVTDRFVYQHFFVAYERQPISIRIKYYKPGTTWLCYGLQFDANLPDDIQKAADDRLPLDVK